MPWIGIDVTDAEEESLERLARETGRSRDALLREALVRLLSVTAPGVPDWRAALRRAMGRRPEMEDEIRTRPSVLAVRSRSWRPSSSHAR